MRHRLAAILALPAALALAPGCALEPGRGASPARPPAGAEGDLATPGSGEDASARVALARFVEALEGGRWDGAYALLSARWRTRYTPARLAADWEAGGALSRDAAARVRALLASGARLELSPGAARLPVGERLAARLVEEGGAWRVDALE